MKYAVAGYESFDSAGSAPIYDAGLGFKHGIFDLSLEYYTAQGGLFSVYGVAQPTGKLFFPAIFPSSRV